MMMIIIIIIVASTTICSVVVNATMAASICVFFLEISLVITVVLIIFLNTILVFPHLHFLLTIIMLDIIIEVVICITSTLLSRLST